MSFKCALLYIKKNPLKCLPLLITVSLFTLLFLYFYSINDVSSYLKEELKEDMKYEININNRICKTNGNYYYTNGENFYEEFSTICEILNFYNSSYYPYLRTVDDSCNQNGDTVYRLFYGIDGDYFSSNDINLIEGRMFEKDKKEIIVPQDCYRYVDGEKKTIVIGDTISLPIGYKVDKYISYKPIAEYYIDFEVVGIYEKRDIDIRKSNEEYMLNQRFYMSKENCIDLYNETIELYKEHNVATLVKSSINYVPNFIFSCSTLYFTSEEDMNVAYENISVEINALNSRIKNESEELKDEYYLSSSADYVNGILSPFESLSENTEFIEKIMIIVFVVILIILILMNIRKRIKEFGIKMALGLDKRQVLASLLIENMLITVVGVCLAIIAYKLTAQAFVNNILVNSLQTKNDLLRIASNNTNDVFSFDDISVDFNQIRFDSLNYFKIVGLQLILLLSITVILFIMTIQPNNIKKSLITS